MIDNFYPEIKKPDFYFQRIVDLNYSEIELSARRIQTLLGFEDNQVPEPFQSLVDRSLRLASKYCKIKADFVEINPVYFDRDYYSLVTRDVFDNFIELNINKTIFKSVKNSEKLLVFLCTAGKEISELSKKMGTEGEILTSYILDIVGSEIVKAAIDKIQGDLEILYRSKGYNITNRYSPGYCDWDVSEQQKLFRLMPQNFCGITLTSNSLMIPTKSVSGIIGIGKNVKRTSYGCNICKSESCIYKRFKT